MTALNPVVWSVYLIRMRSNALYCGITTDVERRFAQHQSGTGAKALRGKGPLLLVWSYPLTSCRSVASKVEYQLKQQSKIVKESLVSGKLDLVDVIPLNLYEEISLSA